MIIEVKFYFIKIFEKNKGIKKNEVWVMTRAWYGISSTGGEAGAATIKLVSMAELEDQTAVETLENDRFVDDLLGGDETREGVDKQIR